MREKERDRKRGRERKRKERETQRERERVCEKKEREREIYNIIQSWHEGPNFQPTNAYRKMSRSQYKLAYVFYRLLKSLRLRWTSRNDRSIEEDELPLQDHKLNTCN